MFEEQEKKLPKKFLSSDAKLIKMSVKDFVSYIKSGFVLIVLKKILTIMEKQPKAPANTFTIC